LAREIRAALYTRGIFKGTARDCVRGSARVPGRVALEATLMIAMSPASVVHPVPLGR